MTKVSVVIPTYNRANLLCKAIDSVLAQTFKDFEIIVVDDGSTDDSRNSMSKQYGTKIKFIHQERKGVSAARNRGILESSGEFVAFLDSDDSWLTQKLEKQIAYFEKAKDVVLQYSLAKIIDEDQHLEWIEPKDTSLTLDDFLNKETFLPASTVILKKSVLIELGGFNERLETLEDLELWLRIVDKYPIGFIPEVFALIKRHPDNAMKQMNKMHLGYVAVFQYILDKHKNKLISPFVKDKLSLNYYLLAKVNFERKKYKKTLFYLKNALTIKPNIGLLFVEEKERLANKILKLIKPYLFFFLTLIKQLKYMRFL